MCEWKSNCDLHRRLEELEEKVNQLRLSRRVLMNLIEHLEKEKSLFSEQMKKENEKLHRENCKYARMLMNKNRRIMELESLLDKQALQDTADFEK